MIVYQHPSSPLPPPWLVGADNLLHRRDEDGFTYAIGQPWRFGRMPKESTDLGGGWRGSVLSDLDPFYLRRRKPGCPMVLAEDMHGRGWAAPIILAEDGSRAFPVAYGPGFKPKLTAEQTDLMLFAQSARTELPAILAGGIATREDLREAAFGWAAAGLVFANHLTSEMLQGGLLLDEILAVNVLVTMTSFRLPEVPEDA